MCSACWCLPPVRACQAALRRSAAAEACCRGLLMPMNCPTATLPPTSLSQEGYKSQYNHPAGGGGGAAQLAAHAAPRCAARARCVHHAERLQQPLQHQPASLFIACTVQRKQTGTCPPSYSIPRWPLCARPPSAAAAGADRAARAGYLGLHNLRLHVSSIITTPRACNNVHLKFFFVVPVPFNSNTKLAAPPPGC